MKRLLLGCSLMLLQLGVWAQVQFNSSHLPMVIINANGVPIPNEPKIRAQMSIIHKGNGTTNLITDVPNVYNGFIGIELRGSSSQLYEKKAYSIELRDASREDLKVPLLGMPEESDWALIAPLNDKTLMRDVLVHTYARAVMPWTPRTRYCEVMLDDDYKGVYILLENIKRDANRVAIKKLESSDISGDKLTGGYILRIDKYGLNGGFGGNWTSTYPPKPGAWQQVWFQYHYPKEEDIRPQQAAYIQKYIKDFEDMMMSNDYKTRYADWIDVDNWVDYLLVQELTKNTDGYRLSAYFYKNRDSEGGKLKMGPLWDFNIAFGIGDYCNAKDYQGWAKDFNTVCPDDQWQIHFWWDRLWQDPAFRDRVGRRWRELRQGAWSTERLFTPIDSITNLLGEARVRNFQRWRVIGTYVWPNSFIGNSYTEEVNFLKTWLANRLAWLDQNMAPLVAVNEPITSLKDIKVFPNPTRGNFWLQAAQDKPDEVYNLSLYDASGKLLHQQNKISLLQPHAIKLNASLSPGLYLWQIVDQEGRIASGKVMIE
ncbi:MAG: CotH kinase family protein [Saprospiraceae bacterium]